MIEIRAAEASIRRIHTAATIVGAAAVVGIAYWCERTYLRWWEVNHPLAEHRARLQRLKTGYQGKREGVSEVAQFIMDILAEAPRV